MGRLIIVSCNIGDDSLLKGKDAFVLPTNPKMRYGAGISEVAFRKAGIDALEKYCEDTFDVGYETNQEKNDMKPTEIRITPGFGPRNGHNIYSKSQYYLFFFRRKRTISTAFQDIS